jgi:CheY-like chemotaxis protein/DNA-binding MarR family transcriptional regulator
MCASAATIGELRTIDVLVVDDDQAVAEALVGYLSKAGLVCKSASDGWGALKLLAEGCRPSVIVTDLRMPELDGMEFVERLTQLGGADRPEIIFASGAAGFDDAVAAMRLGARDMLTKPISGKVLVSAVKSAQIAAQHRRATTPPASEAKPASEEKPDSVEWRRKILKELRAIRGLRSKHFPPDLFSDPCWEMLLDLYDARLAGAEVTVTSLGAASGVPLTTALRRMEALQAHGLITRIEDKDDKRRTIIRLTDSGVEAGDRFLETYAARRET